ncbi:hypothetical protein Patl1_27005 [Pistacia atlantica]|uniref:Uncharacterized protein n=1 Tax=Pistacia atlantica TaxID=434234 RepID=A0ACC1B065_9ROSI|nr:hypothetical protein Patl1_27005 [Pistacia atlantica]
MWVMGFLSHSTDCLHMQFYNDPIMAYMFKYDSIHGVFKGTLKVVDESTLEINEKQIKFFSKRDPAEIPWGDYGAKYIVESSGVFTTTDKASAHIKHNHIVFASLVKACACLGATRQGKQVHACFVISPFCDNDFVKSSLVDTYAKCGLPDDSHPVFDSIKFKDSVSWNAMLSAYARSGRRNEALEMFETVPDRNLVEIVEPLVLSSIVGSCSNLALLELGKQIHGIVIAIGYESGLFISNALVDMYAKCSDIVAAKNIFGRMRRKDVVSWTSIIVGEAQHGRAEEALAIYDAMVSAGVKPSEVTFVGLIYAICPTVTCLTGSNPGWKRC